jgi:aspartyl-tRNA(Asn)/glutamyl-tRNA(Gln) amidotransferase subunit B
MRSKEAANDYRYFPEPDLQPLWVTESQIELVKGDMPALPRELFQKYTSQFGLTEYDASNLTDNKAIALFYESLLVYTKNYKAAANWIMGDVKSYLNENGVDISAFPIEVARLGELIELIESGKVSYSIASQRIFPEMLLSNELSPLEIAEKFNLVQDSDEGAILAFIQQVINENPSEVERYKNGEKQLTGFFMGQLMKVSKGKADPKSANSLLRSKLEE